MMTEKEIQEIVRILRQAFIDAELDIQVDIPLDPDVDALIQGGD